MYFLGLRQPLRWFRPNPVSTTVAEWLFRNVLVAIEEKRTKDVARTCGEWSASKGYLDSFNRFEDVDSPASRKEEITYLECKQPLLIIADWERFHLLSAYSVEKLRFS